MKFYTQLGKSFGKLPIILLPIYVCLGPLFFWVSFEQFQNNFILDRYASETMGKVTGKGRHTVVRYNFTPKTAYASIGTRGLLDTEEILKVDPTRNPRRHSSSQTVSYLKDLTLKKGDTVTVEYALHKGKFVSRIHNPLIPFMAILLLILGVVFIIAPTLAILYKLKLLPKE